MEMNPTIFNRPIVELKLVSGAKSLLHLVPFNRLIVELKRSKVNPFVICKIAFNRPDVELKRVIRNLRIGHGISF